MHSHSGLERELQYSKHLVLVDECFADRFIDIAAYIKHLTIGKTKYIEVPILMFVEKGGVFKNFDR